MRNTTSPKSLHKMLGLAFIALLAGIFAYVISPKPISHDMPVNVLVEVVSGCNDELCKSRIIELDLKPNARVPVTINDSTTLSVSRLSSQSLLASLSVRQNDKTKNTVSMCKIGHECQLVSEKYRIYSFANKLKTIVDSNSKDDHADYCGSVSDGDHITPLTLNNEIIYQEGPSSNLKDSSLVFLATCYADSGNLTLIDHFVSRALTLSKDTADSKIMESSGLHYCFKATRLFHPQSPSNHILKRMHSLTNKLTLDKESISLWWQIVEYLEFSMGNKIANDSEDPLSTVIKDYNDYLTVMAPYVEKHPSFSSTASKRIYEAQLRYKKQKKEKLEVQMLTKGLSLAKQGYAEPIIGLMYMYYSTLANNYLQREDYQGLKDLLNDYQELVPEMSLRSEKEDFIKLRHKYCELSLPSLHSFCQAKV